MKIGLITVNGFDFHPNGRFREEGGRAGHSIQLINPYSLGCVLGEGGSPAMFTGKDMEPDLPDLVMPRQGSPMGEYGFVLLRQFAALGIPIINSIEGVTIARNQFISLQRLALAGLPVPPSVFVTRKEMFFTAVQQLGGFPVVVKQVDGMGGDGVGLVDSPETAKIFLAGDFSSAKGVVVQAFVEPEGRQDLRLLVVGGRVAGAMALTPAPGLFRTNIHQNATARPFKPPQTLAGMAVRAARACSLEIAGIDMMVLPDTGSGMGTQGRTLVIEANYSPGFRGLEAATGLNIGGMILAHAAARACSIRS